MKVTWSPKAIDDLAEILDYIEFDLESPKAAEKFYQKVILAVERFADVPDFAIKLRLRNGLVTEYRYTIVGNWMIFFSLQQQEGLVVRILYGKSDYMETLFGSLSGN